MTTIIDLLIFPLFYRKREAASEIIFEQRIRVKALTVILPRMMYRDDWVCLLKHWSVMSRRKRSPAIFLVGCVNMFSRTHELLIRPLRAFNRNDKSTSSLLSVALSYLSDFRVNVIITRHPNGDINHNTVDIFLLMRNAKMKRPDLLERLEIHSVRGTERVRGIVRLKPDF